MMFGRLVLLGYVNSFLATLSPFHPHSFQMNRTELLHRLNTREALRETMDQQPTSLHLSRLSVFASTGQDTVEPASLEEAMNKEYPSMGSTALAVNVQLQTLSREDNAHVILQVRYDNFFYLSTATKRIFS
jgi:hypothetical protein